MARKSRSFRKRIPLTYIASGNIPTTEHNLFRMTLVKPLSRYNNKSAQLITVQQGCKRCPKEAQIICWFQEPLLQGSRLSDMGIEMLIGMTQHLDKSMLSIYQIKPALLTREPR
jgi:hypothetical protein